MGTRAFPGSSMTLLVSMAIPQVKFSIPVAKCLWMRHNPLRVTKYRQNAKYSSVQGKEGEPESHNVLGKLRSSSSNPAPPPQSCTVKARNSPDGIIMEATQESATPAVLPVTSAIGTQGSKACQSLGTQVVHSTTSGCTSMHLGGGLNVVRAQLRLCKKQSPLQLQPS